MADVKELIQTALDPQSGSFRRRMAVMDLAKSEGTGVVDALVKLLDDEDQYMRREVVSALAKRRDDGAIEPLIKALSDDDDTVQRYAADALGERAATRAIGPLESLADDNSYSVRDAAKRAIERIKRSQPKSEAPAKPAAPVAAKVTEVRKPSPVVPAAPVISKPVKPAPAATVKPVVAAPPVFTPPPAPAARIEPPPVIEAPERARASRDIPASEKPAVSTETVDAEIVFVDTKPETAPVEVPIEIVDHPQVDEPPIEIIEATVVPSEPAPEIEDVDVVALEAVPTTPTKPLPWERALRMRIFFADRLPAAQKLFDAIAAGREALRRDEQQHHKTLMTLGMERADKEDDLDRLKQATEAAQDRMEDLQRQSASKLKEKHRLTQEAAQVWNQMSSSFFPDRKAEREKQVAQLDSDLAGLREKIDEVREELTGLDQEHQRLSGPMAALKESVEGLTKSRDAATHRLVQLERELEDYVVDTVQAFDEAKWQSMLSRLADLSTHGDYLKACMEQLQSSVHRLHAEAVDAKRAEAALERAKAAARSGAESLGAAVAGGFQVAATEKETAVRLSGSVRFQEDHSFLGGYSGASGSARGNGSGQASYVVEQVAWQPAGELAQHVATLTDAWSSAGEQAARLEILAGLRTVRRRQISEYVYFLRSELERDFHQEPQ